MVHWLLTYKSVTDAEQLTNAVADCVKAVPLRRQVLVLVVACVARIRHGSAGGRHVTVAVTCRDEPMWFRDETMWLKGVMRS